MTSEPRTSTIQKRTVIASIGLVSLTGFLGWQHWCTDAGQGEGLAAEDLQGATIAEALEAGERGDALLLDFVEPEDGEGGSEQEISEMVADLGLEAELAGFYADGEHLYRVQGTPTQLSALRQSLEGHELIEGMEADQLYSLPADALSALSGPPAVAGDMGPHKPDRPRYTPDDPMYPLQWHFENIHVPEAWTHTKGKGAVIAVIDTGVAWKDLKWGKYDAKKVPDLEGTDFVGGETFLDNALPEGLDDHAHGTHVTGTIAQATDNGIGVAGVAHEAKIMPLKVLSGDGRGSVAAIANAIRYAADNDADVINMSLGGPLPSRVMAKAVEYAHDKGVTVICAAGNEKRSRVSYPAAYKGSVAVAATNYENTRSFYSNWGKDLDISAPGGDTREDRNGDGHPDGVLQNTIKIQDPAHNDYLWFQGTSMASPHAAGVAGLIVAQGVTNPKEVERVLKETATHPNGVEWDKEYGAGIIDAEKAVQAAGKDYVPERLGFLGLLGLMGLGGIGAASGSGNALRRRLVAGGGLVAGAGLAIGGALSPAAYGAGSLTGLLGSGVFLSALIPVLATLLLLQRKSLRGLLTGLNLGWAALLAHGAVVLPTMMTGIPGGTGWDRAFLAVNAIVCFVMARRLSRMGKDEG
jgi:serine protease